MNYTQEQQAIIDSKAPRICAKSFAGTGKTSVMVGYARERNARMLYLAYNRAIALDASQRFPSNVVCKTTHALAFPSQGVKYKHKLGNLRVGDIASLVHVSNAQAAKVAETLNTYLCSADDRIIAAHIPKPGLTESPIDRAHILDATKKLWKRMQNVNDLEAKQSHDGYLKLYALTRPNLGFPSVLFDEAQDANPVTSQIVAKHSGPLLITGDHYQSIYQWRGARDALTQIPVDETHHLTHSFRFGRGISNAANLMLYWHGEPHRIVGAGPYPQSRFEIDRTQPYAQIARTNMAIIEAAFGALESKARLYFVGGVEGYRLALIEDGYRLFIGEHNNIKDRFLAKYSSLSALNEYATDASDVEMILLVKIIEMYRNQIPELITRVRAQSVDSIEHAQRIFSTAHKSKGLQWRACEMLNDYEDLVEGGELIDKKEINPQEVNLMYVAATRAMESLQLCSQMKDYWDHMKKVWHAQRSAAVGQAA